MEKVSVIIVAGGAGKRMGSEIRKQYLMLDGLPILSRTLLAIDSYPAITRICLVVPKEDDAYCRDVILSPIQLKSEVCLVAGGEKRQQSVYNGLSAVVDTEGIVIIHDGVRPFITADQIEACISAARHDGACILGIPVSDTLKTVADSGFISDTLERESVWLAQTPQAFQFHIIKKAHENAKSAGFIGTDDASLVEHLGHRVKAVCGSPLNIKITTPEDLTLAGAICGLPEYRRP